MTEFNKAVSSVARIGDFDVSPDGTEIIFDRAQDSSSIALIERAG